MAEPTNQMTVIGPDTQIKGEMHFEGTARILGKFDGKITSKGEVQVGDGATCKATIEAGTIVVDGEVVGDITGRERVKLNATAKVTGDVVARMLTVAEGATFLGQCQVGAEAIEKVTSAAAAKSAEERPLTVETRVGRGFERSSRLSSLEAKSNGQHSQPISAETLGG